MNLYLGNSLMDYRGPAEWDKVTLVTLQMGCGQDMEHHKSYYWGTLGTILFQGCAVCTTRVTTEVLLDYSVGTAVQRTEGCAVCTTRVTNEFTGTTRH